MARWICPECEREFDRARQGHVCVPGGTVDDERVVRHYEVGRGRFVNVVRLTGAGQVDERLRGWLTEAFEDAGP
ncbi:hypothetical protein [Dactylosporangium matsuzakiense]|uniref:Uncharacterized protein n=1 Tax=Dactylosporangium matsuzakiense TaxID=53360 RepID=A0A9W6KUU5_9ACTN|nr:hypothetical protein [Dactylosporangium matsuzakiense]UWZ43779.1 hypothetical protein Dmats_41185 [Dactylosporangium matsuzakiense]GLL06830.1 hypothetical protein GCM10017581_085800 [Dactylosporangium matsuzakiense]